MEELLDTLKSIALKAQKAHKGSSSKAFKVGESCDEASEEDVMMKMNSFLFQERFTPSKNIKKDPDERETPESTPKKSKIRVNLEKDNEKGENKSFFKNKKGLMAIREDFDLSSSKEKDEEANLYLMAKLP
ncbi:hypothetical protein CR513_36719, partial [Mucuna pruriens]